MSTSDTSDLILEQQLKKINSAIAHKPPYCQGTTLLAANSFTLFYGKDESARRINLANTSPEQLQHLADTCDPATFGLGQEDVYDEMYRKAGKLDEPDFAVKFTPDALGLLDIVRTELLDEGTDKTASSGPIRAELYKLNVYGPHSFFKAHIDTPRGELMFGSLVLVFPTLHEGGALVLREHSAENSQEWTFDLAALLRAAPKPSLAYVAFFSDVEHEVTPVQSGYRVTITYNLYHTKVDDNDPAPTQVVQPIPTNEAALRDTLQSLLNDPTFLPEGGNLMFPLRHQYPLSTTTKRREEARKALQDITSRLKASDALLLTVVRELGLDTALTVVYEHRTSYYGVEYTMCDHVVRLDDREVDESALSTYLQSVAGGVLLNPDARKRAWLEPKDMADVHWVTSTPWQVNSVKTTYMAHGNEAQLVHAYWKISLFVRVGPAGDRTALRESSAASQEPK